MFPATMNSKLSLDTIQGDTEEANNAGISGRDIGADDVTTTAASSNGEIKDDVVMTDADVPSTPPNNNGSSISNNISNQINGLGQFQQPPEMPKLMNSCKPSRSSRILYRWIPRKKSRKILL